MIYVDASHLHVFLRERKPLSGIQRLTLNSLVGLKSLNGEERVAVLLFDPKTRNYGTCSVTDFLRNRGQDQPALRPAQFTLGDQVLLTEYFWNDNVTALAATRSTFGSARVLRFIHDVIPLALPQLYAGSWVRKFRRFVGDAIVAADVVLTNSDFSLADLYRHFPTPMAVKPATVLKLPHEFLTTDEIFARAGAAHSIIRASQLPKGAEELVGQGFALMVGSLESRKNPHLAVAAWREVAKRHTPMPTLVIVGGYTSHNILWRARLRRTIRKTPSILHLQGCDDEGLKWLYENCRFTIFLSAYEGWGLPVGESLWFGKPVLCSNATSLPEVGGEFVEYVDPANPRKVVEALSSFCVDPSLGRQPGQGVNRLQLRTWDDFSTSLANCLAATHGGLALVKEAARHVQ